MKKIISKLTFVILEIFLASACTTQLVQPISSTKDVGGSFPTISDVPVNELTPEPRLNATIEPGADGQVTVTLKVGEIITAVSGGPVSELTPEPTLNATIEPGTGGQITVTLEDNDKTVNLTIGDSFLLQLSDGYNWEVVVSNESVISQVKNITVVNGTQGVYEAVRVGTATLTGFGNPKCLQLQPPCAIKSIMFELFIVIK